MPQSTQTLGGPVSGSRGFGFIDGDNINSVPLATRVTQEPNPLCGLQRSGSDSCFTNNCKHP